MLYVNQQESGVYTTDNIHPASIPAIPPHRSDLRSPAQHRSAEQARTLRCESKIPRHIQWLTSTVTQTNSGGDRQMQTVSR